MLIQAIIHRLRDGLETRSVFGAAELQDARENTAYTNSPTWFVTPGPETATVTQEDRVFDVTQNVQVIVMREISPNDPRGEAAFYDVRGDRNMLFSQLLNWRPGRLFDPVRYVSGQIIGQNDSRIFYGYTFAFTEEVSPTECGFQGQEDWDGVEIKPFRIKFKGPK